MLNDFHQRFKDLIGQGRPSLTMEEIQKLSDGRVFTADQALEKKLIDDIGYLDDVIATVKKKAGIEDARVIMYHRPWGYKNNIYSRMVKPDFESINLVNIDLSGLIGDTGLQFMYLWNP